MSGWGFNILTLPAQLQGLRVLHLSLLVFQPPLGQGKITWTTTALSVDAYNSARSYRTNVTPSSKGITLQAI